MCAASFLVLTACGEPPAIDGAEAGGDPASLLAAADSACEAVQSVGYDFVLGGTGDLESMIPPFRGTVVATRNADLDHPMMLVHFLPDSLEDGTALPDLTIASDGDSAWVLDLTAGMMTRGGMETGGTDLLEPASYALLVEFMIDGPFQAEIAADTVRLEPPDTIGGVPCDVVYVVYQGGQGQARWFLGTDDHLPRRVERMARGSGMEGAQVLEIMNLEVLASPPALEVFRLSPPDPGIEFEEYMSVLPLGEPAPDWTLLTPDGREVTLSDLRDSVVVLDFWATWCGPCAMAMPGLQAIHEDYSDRPVRVIGINVWEEGDPVAFMTSNGYTYDIVLAGDGVAEDYLVTGIPTFYVIDPEGRIAFFVRGYDENGEEALREHLDMLL